MQKRIRAEGKMELIDRKRHGNRGFTLVSILMALAIIGITVGIGIPSFLEILVDTKLKQAGREVITAMRATRFRAISEARPFGVLMRVTVKGDDPFKSDEVVLFEGTDPTVVDNQYRVIEVQRGVLMLSPPSQGAAIQDFTVGGGGHFVIFAADGSADETGFVRFGKAEQSSDAAELELERYVEVRLDPATTGRMRMRSWDPDEGKWKENG